MERLKVHKAQVFLRCVNSLKMDEYLLSYDLKPEPSPSTGSLELDIAPTPLQMNTRGRRKTESQQSPSLFTVRQQS